ncbi:hypothetical protein B0H14DRAFT_2571814 [Mycena olivaceomarginata]|nr:hypothetical protein B0H14DRAFT_2571814 [Mycena olivaceomarginata]
MSGHKKTAPKPHPKPQKKKKGKKTKKGEDDESSEDSADDDADTSSKAILDVDYSQDEGGIDLKIGAVKADPILNRFSIDSVPRIGQESTSESVENWHLHHPDGAAPGILCKNSCWASVLQKAAIDQNKV